MNEDLLIRMMLEAARLGNASRCNAIVANHQSAVCFKSRAAFLLAVDEWSDLQHVVPQNTVIMFAATIVRAYEPSPWARFAKWFDDSRMNVAGVVFILLLMFAAVAAANPFTFDPWPQESRLHPYKEVRVTLIDAPLPGAACLAMSDAVIDYVLAPLIIQTAGCAIFNERHQAPACVIAMPLTGPAQALSLTALSTPNQVLSHEFMHCLEGHNHVPFISIIKVGP